MTKRQRREYKVWNQRRKARMLEHNFSEKRGGFSVMILGGVIQDGKHTVK